MAFGRGLIEVGESQVLLETSHLQELLRAEAEGVSQLNVLAEAETFVGDNVPDDVICIDKGHYLRIVVVVPHHYCCLVLESRLHELLTLAGHR